MDGETSEFDWSRLTDRERKEIGEKSYRDYGKNEKVFTDGGKLLGWAMMFPRGSISCGGRERAGDVPRLRAASKGLKSVMARFPNAKVDVCGHSLGSMAGQYALSDLSREQSKRINGAWLYEGPNIYSTLNATQKSGPIPTHVTVGSRTMWTYAIW